GGAVGGAMHGAMLSIAEARAAVGVQQMGRGHVAGADGGIGLQGNANQAELQQSRPTGPAIRRRPVKGRGSGVSGGKASFVARSPKSSTATVVGYRPGGGPRPLSH